MQKAGIDVHKDYYILLSSMAMSENLQSSPPTIQRIGCDGLFVHWPLRGADLLRLNAEEPQAAKPPFFSLTIITLYTVIKFILYTYIIRRYWMEKDHSYARLFRYLFVLPEFGETFTCF